MSTLLPGLGIEGLLEVRLEGHWTSLIPTNDALDAVASFDTVAT